MSRSVLVIGAGGVLGSLTATAFEDAGWEVQRGARRERDGFRIADLDRPETIEAAAADVDVVLNTVPHPGLTAERTVLERGGKLVNVSTPPAAAARRLAHEPSGTARGTVLLNAGVAPGVTNLVAADLLAEHPEADAVEIVLTVSASGASGKSGGEFAHRGLTTARRHRTTKIPLPAPFGERRCLGFAEDERGFLGKVAEGREVASYICMTERVPATALLALNAIGVMSVLPRIAFVAGRGGPPKKATGERVAEWVAVLADGERLAARTVECNGDYASTATVSVVFAEALLGSGNGTGAAPAGCYDPDDLFTLALLEPALRDIGVSVVDQPVRPG
jgi:hypothetical protein